jgi:2-amino-4-hydroxy-6-hydroxymethyldihydropteridine diphosphokinase
MQLDREITYLLLGGNLGNREQYLEDALKLIEERAGKIKAKSAIYETAAWGKTDQPGFLNLAVEVETTLKPIELLHVVLGIEEFLGRIREEKWGARVIDIDIILYGEEIVNMANELQIPHPEMQNRKFVMEPLAEIAPNFIHPVFKQTILKIFATLTDNLSVSKR